MPSDDIAQQSKALTRIAKGMRSGCYTPHGLDASWLEHAASTLAIAAMCERSSQMGTLAESMTTWRKARGMSAAQAAQHLGMPRRTLEGIEQGRAFRYEKILRLAIKTA